MRFNNLHLLVCLIIVTYSQWSWSQNVTSRVLASDDQRELFHCTLLISNESRSGMRERKYVDIATPQPVVLGLGSYAHDLQPVFESEAIREAYYGRISFLANIFVDDQGVKKVKLGAYLIAVNRSHYTEETHYIIRSANAISTYYGHPLVEIESQFEPRGEYTLESTGTLGAHVNASYTKLRCTHQSTVRSTAL